MQSGHQMRNHTETEPVKALRAMPGAQTIKGHRSDPFCFIKIAELLEKTSSISKHDQAKKHW